MRNRDQFNELHWDCKQHGCYNVEKRPNFGVFFNCFPGKISMTDIDGTVEVNGHFLFLEFKDSEGMDIPTGQRIYFERLTALSARIVGIIAHVDIPMMCTRAIRIARKGNIGPWEICSTDNLAERIKAWSDAALRRPRFGRQNIEFKRLVDPSLGASP